MRLLPKSKKKKKDKKDKKNKYETNLINEDYNEHSIEDGTNPNNSKKQCPSALYQFAINEYSNTVAPLQSNDDGSQSCVSLEPTSSLRPTSVINNLYTPPKVNALQQYSNSPPTTSAMMLEPNTANHPNNNPPPLLPPSAQQQTPRLPVQPHTHPTRVAAPALRRNSFPSFSDDSEDTGINLSRSAEWSTKTNRPTGTMAVLTALQQQHPPPPSSPANTAFTSLSPDQAQPPSPPSPSPTAAISRRYHIERQQPAPPTSSSEPEMPDSTYEEYYGDSYISKPIRYIYPSGYGNMRPRSFPWRISVLICGSFTWLTVFIVGHCSDQVDWDNYYNDEYEEGMDDDAVVIATRWCGSRALYFMWVLSVLITGLSCAYCSIIGYIKARDFAVANGRSQPPGMVGKSDFYVRIEEQAENGGGASSGRKGHGGGGGMNDTPGKSIYQADGTPRFLGSRIYRPTQAAVHLTSR